MMTARTSSERHWLRIHAFLQRERYVLASSCAAGYPPQARVAGTPLLAPMSWLPASPVPLTALRLEYREESPQPQVTAADVAELAASALPMRADGTRYQSYSEATAALAAPATFENRPVYRLIEADLASGPDPHLIFTTGRYFDSTDYGGAAAHEYAAHEYAAREHAAREHAARKRAATGQRTAMALRAAIPDPCDLAARPAIMAVSALTLRYDRAAGTATFPLHYRDPGRVGHAGGMHQVIPVGVFQPSGEAPWNAANDFSLWSALLREYAEEFLGADEEYGSELAPIDYAAWPLGRVMTDALGDGRIRAWCLGLGADPLSWALDLLVVVVIDAPLYDELFGAMPAENAEGRVLAARSFDEPTIAGLIAGSRLQPAAEALLALAITRRRLLES